MPKPLAIIPTYLRSSNDLSVCETALRTLRETAEDTCDVLVVDDGSPAEPDILQGLARACGEHSVELVAKKRNEGFAKTVNVGLRRCLLDTRDAVLVNADIEFGLTKDWLGLMERQERSDGKGLASVVGALLLYPNGLIQHAGIIFSMLGREFSHRYNFGPGDLPEAQVATVCPVTGALMFIRHESLEGVGLFDETFRLGWEDVDYNVRAWLSGRECVYQPGVRAIHHESLFRGGDRVNEKIAKWTDESWRRFVAKYAQVSFAEFVPNMMG